VSHGNTGLIQIIPLIFLQEGKKKAPYVQPEKVVDKIAITTVHLGDSLLGSHLYNSKKTSLQFKNTSSL